MDPLDVPPASSLCTSWPPPTQLPRSTERGEDAQCDKSTTAAAIEVVLKGEGIGIETGQLIGDSGPIFGTVNGIISFFIISTSMAPNN